MLNFMNDPTGEMPWEEEVGTEDVRHVKTNQVSIYNLLLLSVRGILENIGLRVWQQTVSIETVHMAKILTKKEPTRMLRLTSGLSCYIIMCCAKF